MDPGLVSSLSGALAQSRRVDVISNNIANADTPGFKGDDLMFDEALQSAQNPHDPAEMSSEPMKDSELLSRAGDEKRVVLYGGEFTDLKAGSYKVTNNPLDLAIEGNGFLEVLTPNGVRLTRAGNLALDQNSRLVNRDGFLVLGAGAAGADPATRALTVGAGQMQIDPEGNIYSSPDRGGALIGKLSLVKVENPAALRKAGGNLFEAPAEAFAMPANAPSRAPAAVGAASQPKPNPLGSTLIPPKIHQGMIEASNVSPVQEMTKLIEAHRLFEQNTKLMQTHGDSVSRLSEIGRF
jgi:flagellar basal-body rod protein FlgG